MADRYSRPSVGGRRATGESGRSGRSVRMPQTNPRRPRSTGASYGRASKTAPSNAGGRSGRGASPTIRSVRVGDVGRSGRAGSMNAAYRSYMQRFVKIGIALLVVVAVLFGLYLSPLFGIANVTVTGVSHITATAMAELAAVPVDSTLLRVDTAGIKSRLLTNAWVKDVAVKRVLPSTLELAITEREVAAIVQVPSEDGGSTRNWAIASDGIWLMDIPDQGSDEAANVSSQVYADAESALKITNVPYGVSPQVGSACTDESVLNALSIVSGMTTSLKERVASVNVSGVDNTVLTLDDGVQIAFGDDESIRDKERICLELLEQHAGSISYINVRTPDRPTWRSL